MFYAHSSFSEICKILCLQAMQKRSFANWGISHNYDFEQVVMLDVSAAIDGIVYHYTF